MRIAQIGDDPSRFLRVLMVKRLVPKIQPSRTGGSSRKPVNCSLGDISEAVRLKLRNNFDRLTSHLFDHTAQGR